MRALLAVALLALAGCEPKIEVPEQTATVACGTCVFKIPDSRGCYWSARIDDEYYPVTGAVPEDHDAHAPDGMCSIERTATVAGTLTRGVFHATTFDLHPADDLGEVTPHEH